MFGIFFPFKLLIPPRRRRALVPVTSVLGKGHRHRHSRGAKGSRISVPAVRSRRWQPDSRDSQDHRDSQTHKSYEYLSFSLHIPTPW